MEPKDNYQLQAQQAQQRFLSYDQTKLAEKLGLKQDEQYFYVNLIDIPYRICRKTGTQQRQEAGQWVDANSHREVMTLLDLVCDSKAHRFLSGKWKNMTDFGLMFHRSLLENKIDPAAEKFQQDPEGFRKACETLDGKPFPQGDIAYSIELFDGLAVLVQLWFGDEEFPACLRFLWDANALMYIKYETMYFARSLLLQEIESRM